MFVVVALFFLVSTLFSSVENGGVNLLNYFSPILYEMGFRRILNGLENQLNVIEYLRRSASIGHPGGVNAVHR